MATKDPYEKALEFEHANPPAPFNPAYDARAESWHRETITSMETDGLYIEGGPNFMPQEKRKEEYGIRYDRLKNAALAADAEMADRRAVYSFEVDGTHVRWYGTLDQFAKDCRDYCDKSPGEWKCKGKKSFDFHCKTTGTITKFRAVKH